MPSLLEGPAKDTFLRIEGEKKPSIVWESNSGPLCYEACALPLCYNHVPHTNSTGPLPFQKIETRSLVANREVSAWIRPGFELVNLGSRVLPTSARFFDNLKHLANQDFGQ